LPSRFALHLRPWLVDNHGDHPSLDFIEIDLAIVEAAIMEVIS
jgi:hypothetical protein